MSGARSRRHDRAHAHARRAAAFLADHPRSVWHDRAVWHVRERRDAAAAELPEWEALRARAGELRRAALAELPELLERFEANARARGAQVHWARDAAELRRIVQGLLAERGVQRVVKSKSMLTEECRLNPALEAAGIEVVDTDLGERIVQLRGEPPSHIVMPAIHLRRHEVGELFHRELGSPAGLDDPEALTRVARSHLREKFLAAQAGITGANFALADTGGLVVCTNEGNADLGTVLPPLHIACVGIEKVIPGPAELAVLLRLLARSATGQAQTAYTSHFHGPAEGGELHVVLVDNGRSSLAGREAFRDALACIRCGACLNTCPVYRRSGGHSYGTPVAGPIGSVLEPARDPAGARSLPGACSLCGSCSDVCPVRIDLHHQLLAWRGELLARGHVGRSRRWGLAALGRLLRHPALYERAGRLARAAARRLPRRLLYVGANVWGRGRELPPPPPQAFRDWYRERRGG